MTAADSVSPEIFSDPDVLDPELWNLSSIIFEASVRLSWIHHEGQEFTLKSVLSAPEIFLSLPGTVESGTMSLLLSDGSPVFFRVTESGKDGFCRFESLSQMFKGLKPLQDSLGPDRPGPCEQTGVSLCHAEAITQQIVNDCRIIDQLFLDCTSRFEQHGQNESVTDGIGRGRLAASPPVCNKQAYLRRQLSITPCPRVRIESLATFTTESARFIHPDYEF